MADNESKKRAYVPPQVTDVSGFGARGQVEGWCVTGTDPTAYTCTSGGVPSQDSNLCSPTGFNPSFGGCTGPGGLAQEGCYTGSLFTSG
jgi:hypothetical protein